MTIRKQITLSFALILCSIFLVAWLGLNSISKLERAYDDTVKPSTVLMLNGARLNQALFEHYLANLKLLYSSENEQDDYLRQSMEIRESNLTRYNTIKSLVDMEGRSLLQQFKIAWDSYSNQTEEVQLLIESNKLNQAQHLINESSQYLDEAMLSMKKLVDKNERDIESVGRIFEQEYHKQKTHFKIISAIAILVTMSLLILLSQRFEKSIMFIAQYTRLLAQGDFSQNIQMAKSDEVAEIINAINKIPMAQSIIIQDFKNRLADIDEKVAASHEITNDLTAVNIDELRHSIVEIKQEIESLISAFDEQIKTRQY